MKDFEGQRQFNPAKLPNLGEPLQTLDITPQISQAYREKQRMDQGYLNALQVNERQELDNLDIEAANAERAAKNQSGMLDSLMAFAPSLVKMGQDQIKSMEQEKVLQGKMKKFDMDFSDIDQLPYYQQQMAELEASKLSNDQKAAEAFRRTQNYELARVYKSLGASERVGFAQAFLAEKRAEFPAYLAELMTSSEEEITVGGKTFKIKDADGLAENSAAAKAGYRKFLIQNGIQGMNDFFVEENFTGGEDGARNATYKLVNKKTKHDSKIHAENNLIKEVNVTAAKIKTNIATANGTGLLNAYSLLQDEHGNQIGGREKTKEFTNTLKSFIDSRTINSQEDLMTFLRNTPDPAAPGRTMADRHNLVTGLKVHMTSARISDARDYSNAKAAEWTQAGGLRDQYLNLWNQKRSDPNDQVNLNEYLSAQQASMALTNKEDTQLKAWWQNQSEHGQNVDDNMDLLQQMVDNGEDLPSPEQIRMLVGDANAANFINIANQRRTNSQRTGAYSKSYGLVRTAVQEASGYTGRDSTQVSTRQAYLISDLHRDVIKQIKILQDQKPEVYGNDPLLAEQHAVDYVLKNARANGLTKTGKLENLTYSAGSNNEFDAYFNNPTIQGRRQSVTTVLADIQKQQEKFFTDYKSYGLDLTKKGAFVDDATLLRASKNYYNSDGTFNENFRMPEAIKQLDALIPDKNQLQIFQQLMETNELIPVDANNKPIELLLPPSLDPKFKETYFKGGIDSRTQTLLNNAKTTAESLRIGASSSLGFQSARIPERYGAPLKKVADGAGLDFKVVAALVQAESGFQDIKSPERNNGTFDGGPFQVNTEYYSYTPGDIDGNADQALAQLLKVKAVLAQNGITEGHPHYVDGMLAGYNAGQNSLNIENGNLTLTETQEAYVQRVRSAQAGLGDQSQLSNSSLHRGMFRTTHPDTGTGYTVPGAFDYKGRPVVLSQTATAAFDRMVRESNGVVKWTDVHSAQRSESKNRAVGGVPGSNHLGGNAVDIHGASKEWIKEHGHKYGWENLKNKESGGTYTGHDGHFDFTK